MNSVFMIEAVKTTQFNLGVEQYWTESQSNLSTEVLRWIFFFSAITQESNYLEETVYKNIRLV